jgi:Tol biopolymer transport system component
MIDGGDEQLVLQSSDLGASSKDWSSDGRLLLLNADPPGGTSAIWALPLFGDRKPYPLVKTTAPAGEATMSPNGRWVAYASDESGATEIYVKPFEGPSHVQISPVGGATPVQ